MTFDEIRSQATSEWKALQQSERPRILVGTGTCGRAAGALAVVQAIKEHLYRRNIEASVTEVGCIGLCYAEPLVDIVKPNHPRVCYQGVNSENVSLLLDDYLIHDHPRPDLALGTIGEKSVIGIPKL